MSFSHCTRSPEPVRFTPVSGTGTDNVKSRKCRICKSLSIYSFSSSLHDRLRHRRGITFILHDCGWLLINLYFHFPAQGETFQHFISITRMRRKCSRSSCSELKISRDCVVLCGTMYKYIQNVCAARSFSAASSDAIWTENVPLSRCNSCSGDMQPVRQLSALLQASHRSYHRDFRVFVLSRQTSKHSQRLEM